MDGSTLRLPATPALLRVFGTKTVTNQGGATGTCYPEARMSVLYDLLNDLALDARREPGAVGEVELALQQAAQLPPDDLLLWDRGFTGFVLMALVRHQSAHFLGRCLWASFLPAQELFRRNRARRSFVTELFAPEDQRAKLQRRGWLTRLRVRFVSVRLVTSLLDEATYPTGDFLELYHCRWGHETYYGRLKGRLDLEPWSGETEAAVRQDFWATVFLANVESVLSQPAQTQLQTRSATRQHPVQVNRADSFHALKSRVLDLLASDTPAEDVIRQLQQWFAANPVSVRPERKAPRRAPSLARSYHFQRHVRKAVY